MQLKPEHKHTHPHRTPQPGVAGYRQSTHKDTHTPQRPRREWRGVAETRAQAHAPTPHTPARSGRVQAEHAHKHTHTPAPQPGVAGRSRNPRPNTHTHTTHSSQEWRGTGGAGTQTHTYPNTPARSGRAQPKPGPKHTHPQRRPQRGVAGYKRSTQTNTHTPQNHSQDWRSTAETRAQTHRRTPHIPSRTGRAEGKHAHKHTDTQATQAGVAGRSRNPSPSRQPHRTPQPGVAGYRQSTHTNTHTPQHPS